ncbi:MAG: LysR family transcriptional regulator [Pseudomonadota bacterium]
MENWTEIKTAYLLGKFGTVSATAEALGVHRATIIRRVESLEQQLKGKLFQRHAKGYTPTEFGIQLITVAEESDRSFRQLIMKARSQEEGFKGDFTITCPEMLDHFVFPAVKQFKTEHPNIEMKLRPSNEVLKLEYGDANVAITFGDPPEHPDYVILPLTQMKVGLFSAASHARGSDNMDGGAINRSNYSFVLSEEDLFGEPINRWIDANVAQHQIVMTCSTIRGTQDAILSGLGAGFLPIIIGSRSDLVEQIIPSEEEWKVPIWLVTHVDLHRSAKVQSFLSIVKQVPDAVAIQATSSISETEKCPTCVDQTSRHGSHDADLINPILSVA